MKMYMHLQRDTRHIEWGGGGGIIKETCQFQILRNEKKYYPSLLGGLVDVSGGHVI